MKRYSKESYRSLIGLALDEGYEFISFLDDRGARERCIYLRHDVDRSPSMAAEIAEINASLGVRATFCFLLRSPGYNLLSYAVLDIARRIGSLGQHLSLHYAVPPSVPPGDAEFGEIIRADFELLRRHLPDAQPSFSWHDPTPDLIARGLDFEVPGLVNIYGARFFTEVPYYSDSNMRYTVAEFEKFIRAGTPALHLLLHPLFWVAGGADLVEAWANTWQYMICEQVPPALGTREAMWRGFTERWYRGLSAESDSPGGAPAGGGKQTGADA